MHICVFEAFSWCFGLCVVGNGSYIHLSFLYTKYTICFAVFSTPSLFVSLLIVTISIITSSHSLLHYLNINSLLAQNKNKKRKAKNNSSSQTLYRLQIPQPNQHPSASVSKSQRLQVAYRLTLGRLSHYYTATLTTTVC